MDLRIKGRVALVCASTSGIGLACATALAREGVKVFINGRDEARLAHAQQFIQKSTGNDVSTVCANINLAEGRAKIFEACPTPDILINNNAGPTPGKFQDWDEAQWLSALNGNLLAPIFLIQGYVAGMQARKFGRIVNVTSAMVKSPRIHQGLSTTARTGLTAFCKALSIDVARDNVTINNLLPERIDTGRLKQMVERMVVLESITAEEARLKIADTIAAKRFGTPEEFGDACAFICSAQAGYISGQNIQLDGGSYPGLI
ncbi:FabG Dehydrogenases with different specificities (related to short-chain alcohol dehydrogenases) [Burkholderiaceae bacterium]